MVYVHVFNIFVVHYTQCNPIHFVNKNVDSKKSNCTYFSTLFYFWHCITYFIFLQENPTRGFKTNVRWHWFPEKRVMIGIWNLQILWQSRRRRKEEAEKEGPIGTSSSTLITRISTTTYHRYQHPVGIRGESDSFWTHTADKQSRMW